MCRSFVAGRRHRLRDFTSGTLYLPGATSLRMGPLGYQSDAQSSLSVSFNSLRSYAESLNAALTKPYPPYETIGLREGEHYSDSESAASNTSKSAAWTWTHSARWG